MTQLTLTLPDSQSAFIIKVLRAFDYVKVEKKVKIQDPPLSVEHKHILDGISEAVEEINLHKKGVKKMQSGDDFLEELKREGYL